MKNLVIINKNKFNQLNNSLRQSFKINNLNLKLGPLRELIAHSLGFKSLNSCLEYIKNGKSAITPVDDFINLFFENFNIYFKKVLSEKTIEKTLEEFYKQGKKRLIFTRLEFNSNNFSDRPYLNNITNETSLKFKKNRKQNVIDKIVGERALFEKSGSLRINIFDNYQISREFELKESNLIGSLFFNPLLSIFDINHILTFYSNEIEEMINKFNLEEKIDDVENEIFYDPEHSNIYKYQTLLDRLQFAIIQFSEIKYFINKHELEDYIEKLPEYKKDFAVRLYISYTHNLMRYPYISQISEEEIKWNHYENIIEQFEIYETNRILNSIQ